MTFVQGKLKQEKRLNTWSLLYFGP